MGIKRWPSRAFGCVGREKGGKTLGVGGTWRLGRWRNGEGALSLAGRDRSIPQRKTKLPLLAGGRAVGLAERRLPTTPGSTDLLPVHRTHPL